MAIHPCHHRTITQLHCCHHHLTQLYNYPTFLAAHIDSNNSSTTRAASMAAAPHLGNSSLPNFYFFWLLALAAIPAAPPAVMRNRATQYLQINYYYLTASIDGNNSSTTRAASMASAPHLGDASLPNYFECWHRQQHQQYCRHQHYTGNPKTTAPWIIYLLFIILVAGISGNISCDNSCSNGLIQHWGNPSPLDSISTLTFGDRSVARTHQPHPFNPGFKVALPLWCLECNLSRLLVVVILVDP